ncbi:phage portal protein [Actinomadura atramentaria]|uniref:phage portal protein n=1 Tax=Actinomadura atramentaria TaxID=1990 RepID=UPI000377803A|nr:phage portal protein [Actinomadura atramentaria]
MNRYATSWAFYLGHHWAYRREFGEPQITFNYARAFADYANNFTFSRGVHFESAPAFQHIIPALLQRIWEVDNDKAQTLWSVGNHGSVSGDSFVKVAYEPPFEDAAGNPHPGRVRILPLNSSFCFPEWHPHDRERLLRFKLKYRFWGTTLEGTRQVFTYTEILTDDRIEEYVNDELIDSRPNPLGQVPIVHIPNIPVAGSPWGLSDIHDIIPLNREYNEKATNISDIINYHASPVTIITGAKASNLEKGPKKVWGGLPKDANVFNLEGGTNALPHALAYLDMLKRSMHEMTGVPESALGQMQPISNTSGVALSIQYQPMIQKMDLKRLQYTVGLRRINELALRTLFLHEPETLAYNPESDGLLTEGQALVIDPNDPAVYDVKCVWSAPLPVDVLVKLNEIQAKLALGLESKVGALRDLGSEFPDEKMAEINDELIDEAKKQGAVDLVRVQVQQAIAAITGVMPTPDGGAEPVMGPPPAGEGESPQPQTNPMMGLDSAEVQNLAPELLTQAYGTKLAQRRAPNNNSA